MLAIVAIGSAISLGAAGMDESVLAELVRLEKETGLAIAFYENELEWFPSRSALPTTWGSWFLWEIQEELFRRMALKWRLIL